MKPTKHRISDILECLGVINTHDLLTLMTMNKVIAPTKAVAVSYYPPDERGVRPATAQVWSPYFQTDPTRKDFFGRGAKSFSGLTRYKPVTDALNWATRRYNIARWEMSVASRTKTDRVSSEVNEAATALAERAISSKTVEYSVKDSAYKLVGLSDPANDPTMDARRAIAQRLIAVGPLLPRYIPGMKEPAVPSTSTAEKKPVTPAEVKQLEKDFLKNKKETEEFHAEQKKAAEKKEREEAKRREAIAQARKQAKEKEKQSRITNQKELAMSTKKTTTKSTKKTDPKKTAAPASALAKAAAEAGSTTAKKTGGGAAKKAAEKSGGKFAGYATDAKIKVLNKESEFADGSIRDQVFKKLLKCATVGEAQKASADPWHLKQAVKSKKLKVG